MHTNFSNNNPSTATQSMSPCVSESRSMFDEKEETTRMHEGLASIRDARDKRKPSAEVEKEKNEVFSKEGQPAMTPIFSMDSSHGVILKCVDSGDRTAEQAAHGTTHLETVEDRSSFLAEPVSEVNIPVASTAIQAESEVMNLKGHPSSTRLAEQSRGTTMSSVTSDVYYDETFFLEECSHRLPSFIQNRRTTIGSCISELSHLPDDYTPPTESIEWEDEGSKRRSADTSLSSPNDPHPALEFPPLYFLIQRFPRCLEFIRLFYRFRWRVSYPLQKRVVFSTTLLRKAGIYLTWGEFLLMLPFFAALVVGTLYSFVFPSVSVSGHACRTPLIFAFATAMHNSIFTLLLGIPFERGLWYHKLSGRITFVNAILHTYVSFWYPVPHAAEAYEKARPGADADFLEFSFADRVNSAGSILLIALLVMQVTSISAVRSKFFEVFYYVHVAFAAAMVGCAFYHTGVLVPILGALCWGGDILVRKLLMAAVRYPRSASIRIISDTVVEMSFPNCNGFDFNPGQYIYMAVPELSVFEWHPFSLSSSPRQKLVTLHIRKSGNWTSKLYELAKKKQKVSILCEGPYGSLGVDLVSRDRYKMVMLFSGGIGVTPAQSICNQLLYEHTMKQRDLKKLSFIWIERDPIVMKRVEVLRRTSSVRYSVDISDPQLESALERVDNERNREETAPMGLASTILSMVPVSGTTDEQLESEYKSEEVEIDDDELEHETDDVASSRELFRLNPRFPAMRSIESEIRRVELMEAPGEGEPSGPQHILEQSTGSMTRDNAFVLEQDSAHIAHDGLTAEFGSPARMLNNNEDNFSVDDTFLDKAYNGQPGVSPIDVLDLQVYLTGQNTNSDIAHLPFVQKGRPDIKKIFFNMKQEAIKKKEKRVAVCVCAPLRVVQLCRKACIKYSDKTVRFDFHEEVFS